mmetsp:Transcript_9033/g.25951  ORF Transcript_9033/g.25951 Transcript_9033/m.25951 type:complete len:278 (+) Transcript_9033:1-834(+)
MDQGFQTLYYLTGWVPKDYYFGDTGRVGEFEAQVRWPEPGGRVGSVGSGKMKFSADPDNAGIELLEFCRYVCSLLPRTSEDYKHLVRLQQGLLMYVAELYDIQHGAKSWDNAAPTEAKESESSPPDKQELQSAGGTEAQTEKTSAANLQEDIQQYIKQCEEQDKRVFDLQHQLEVSRKSDSERENIIVLLEERIAQMEERKLGDTTEVISSLEDRQKEMQEELDQTREESRAWQKSCLELESTILDLKKKLKEISRPTQSPISEVNQHKEGSGDSQS